MPDPGGRAGRRRGDHGRRARHRAAAGRSNKQIAQHLFITTGTVETHLRHVFQRLDITSRAVIPANLAFAAQARQSR